MLLRFFGIALLLALAACRQTSTSTATVSVFSTTTVHVSGDASATHDACRDFVGACIVYGDGGAPFITTVFVAGPGPPASPAPPSPPSPPTPPAQTIVTSTTTIPRTVSVTDTGACGGFIGACVVYGTDGGARTTVFSGDSTARGNSHGFIDNSEDDQGQIGGAPTSLETKKMAIIVGLFALGFAILIGL